MTKNEEELKANLKHYASIAYKRGLVWGKSGNISVRLDKESFLISASGAYLSALNYDEIVQCSISNKIKYDSGKPSIESKMHKAIYQVRIDINAILHSQPFYTTLLACSNIPIDTKLFPEAIAYLGRIERVAYYHPGSDELAEEIALKVLNADVLISPPRFGNLVF